MLVSGIFWTGNPHRLLTLWAADRADVLLSAEVMDEYTRVLQEVAAELEKADLAQRWLFFIARHTVIIDAEPRIHVCRDPDDDKYVPKTAASAADSRLSTG